jgi:acyl-CoA thioesterase
MPPSVLAATQVTASPDVPDRYVAQLAGDWNAPLYPSGGVTTALALRSMEAALGDPQLRLRTFTTMFVSTVASGHIDVDVEKLRLGKRMSHLRATVHSNGAEGPGHIVTAAFGEVRDGFEFTHATMPDCAPPEQCPGPGTPPPGTPVWRSSFFDNLEMRRVRLFHAFETGWEGGRAEALRWMRYTAAPRLADGRIDPFTLAGIADTMPASIAQYLGPGYPLFHAPSVDLTMHFLADTDDEWLLVKSVAQWAGDGYASAQVLMWDRAGRLIVHGSQLMLLRFPEPEALGLKRA